MSSLTGGTISGGFSSPMLDVISAGGTQKQSSSQEIESVGTEFESVFLSMMLKEMRNSLEGGGFFGEDGSDTYGGMFDLFIGKHLAQAKPLGIADMLLEQYKKQSATPSDGESEVDSIVPKSYTA